MTIPILDLSLADNPRTRPLVLKQLFDAAFNVGFLYIKNHGVNSSIVSELANKLPNLFHLSIAKKLSLSKLNSPHFLGYNGYAQETTLGKRDLREQFDYATELPIIWKETNSNNKESKAGNDNYSQLYWRLRGPNQWPAEDDLKGFREALTRYHNALAALSYRFVHLIEEAFGMKIGTFDQFFIAGPTQNPQQLQPQHRIKLLKYPKTSPELEDGQGVGPHKDSSGWLTFLYQVGNEPGLEVLSQNGEWLSAPPVDGTFVVNFGNAFEAATEGAVKATVHRVKAPTRNDRYSIPFFMGLPLDLTVSHIRECFPREVTELRKRESQSAAETAISAFLDPRWDRLGESQLRKWIRSHEDVGRKWYGDVTVDYYLQ